MLAAGGGTSALSCPKAAPALSGEADTTASSPSPAQPSARARFGSPAATGSGHRVRLQTAPRVHARRCACVHIGAQLMKCAAFQAFRDIYV